LKVLFIGDIVGKPGRQAAKQLIALIKREKEIDFCIVNGENAAGGHGITYVIANELYSYGVDGITMGNHTWSKREIMNFIDSDNRIIRPCNFSDGLPGKGSTILCNERGELGLINLIGRVYMEPAECPFKRAMCEVRLLKQHVKCIIVDFHAEATSEKSALAWYLDGKVSAVFGTHTHVQTSDERILPFGTAFISDVGMTGPSDGIIGMDREIVIDRFLTGMPTRYDVSKSKAQFNAVVVDIDEKNGKTTNIERIFKNIL
jgi:2',3'-cyclic-nucleotide 2'-phosphodiesterase